MRKEKQFIEDFKLFMKNNVAFDVIVQQVAKEEGLGELSKNEVKLVRHIIIKSMQKIAKEK